MPIPSTRFERAEQVLRWLRDGWPLNRPIRIKWVARLIDDTAEANREKDYTAELFLREDGFEIQLSRRCCRTWEATIDTIIHEYAHAMVWDVPHFHGRAWGAEYGELYEAFHDGTGWRDSRKF